MRYYYQLVEQRGIDPGHEVLQIPADLKNPQLGESGEESACFRRGRWVLASLTWKGLKFNFESFKPSHHGEVSDHLLG